MPVLDTSFLIDIIRGKTEALRKLYEIEADGLSLNTTQINVLELYKGAYLSEKTTQNIQDIRNILEYLFILNIDENVYEVFGSISARLSTEGRTIGAFDELIASIALCNDGKIVTKDKHFQQVPTLEVIEY